MSTKTTTNRIAKPQNGAAQVEAAEPEAPDDPVKDFLRPFRGRLLDWLESQPDICGIQLETYTKQGCRTDASDHFIVYAHFDKADPDTLAFKVQVGFNID